MSLKQPTSSGRRNLKKALVFFCRLRLTSDANKNATTHPGEVKYVLVYWLHGFNPLLVGGVVVRAAVVLSVGGFRNMLVVMQSSSAAVLTPPDSLTHIALSMSRLCRSPSRRASRKRPLTARAALACDELSWTMASDSEDRTAALRGRFLQVTRWKRGNVRGWGCCFPQSRASQITRPSCSTCSRQPDLTGSLTL